MFIGSHRIKSEKKLKDGYIEITFEPEIDAEGNEREVIKYVVSPEILEYIRTEEESDASRLRELRTEFLVKQLIAVLLQHNIYYDEYTHVMTVLDQTMENHRKAAVSKLWGAQEFEQSVHECNKILTS